MAKQYLALQALYSELGDALGLNATYMEEHLTARLENICTTYEQYKETYKQRGISPIELEEKKRLLDEAISEGSFTLRQLEARKKRKD